MPLLQPTGVSGIVNPQQQAFMPPPQFQKSNFDLIQQTIANHAAQQQHQHQPQSNDHDGGHSHDHSGHGHSHDHSGHGHSH